MLTLIAAVSQNGCIGKNGKLPWHIPEDLKYFKSVTMGHPVIMGRKTWEGLPEKFRPLPGRQNIVVTSKTEYVLPEGVLRANNLDNAFSLVGNESAYVIGGAEIYTQAISRVQMLDITKVEQVVDGDAFFPTIDPTIWREISHEPHDGFTRLKYERIS